MLQQSSTKTILLLVPRFNIGGAETYTAMLARLLREAGYRVILASGGGNLATELQREGFRHYFLPIRFSTYISAILLQFIIKWNHIDLIHANSSAAAITAVRHRHYFHSNIPIVYTAHGIFGNYKSEKLLHECDKIITVSNFVRNNAIVNNNYAPEQLETIYIGIPQPQITSKDNLLQQLHIPSDAFILALVARIKNLNNKGHRAILNILHEHPLETRNWHLLIIGSGKGENELQKLIKEFHLQDRVHFLGHQLHVANYTQFANVMVLPSYFETFGLALAEGMALGKPGVAYAIGGTPEVITDKETGFLVEKDDEYALFERLQLLAQSPKLCQEMGAKAQKDIATRFDIATMLSKTIAIYKNLLK